MNERIKLLAEQAEGTKKHVPAVWQFYDHELEKFAELIVRECVYVSEGYFGFKDHTPGTAIANEIKQHFGVEDA